MTSHVPQADGERCQVCDMSEARCAYTGQCCDLCSHFRHLDDHGNDRVSPQRTARCGTDSGYRRHLRDNTPTCQACQRAHRRDYLTYQLRKATG